MRIRKESIEDRTFVVHGLNYETSLSEMIRILKNKFKHTGVVTNIRIPSSKKDVHKGYAFVTFNKIRQMEMTMVRNNGRVLEDGSKISIEKKLSDEERRVKKKKKKKVVRKKKKKKMKVDDEESRTVFLKNLPTYEISEDVLKEVFEKYGEIDYVKIVKRNNMNVGSAFVLYKYSSTKLFDHLESRKLIFGNNIGGKSEFYTNHDLKIGENTIFIARYKKKEELAQKRKERDKRNIYLSKEGVIQKNSPASQGIPPMIMKYLQQNYIEKMQKIKNNPNIHVSKTRLKVTMIPENFNESNLRTIFQKVFKKKEPTITHVSILRGKQTYDNRRGDSKGTGFIEFETYEEALFGLREVNNNPHLIKNKRMFVEFALIDKTKLLRKTQFQKRKKKYDEENITYKSLKRKRKPKRKRKNDDSKNKGEPKRKRRKFHKKTN